MLSRLFGLSVLAIVASPVLADTAEDVLALSAAIEAAGCVVTNENGDAVLKAAGLTEEQVFAAIAAMYEAGTAVLEPDGSMSLHTAACQ